MASGGTEWLNALLAGATLRLERCDGQWRLSVSDPVAEAAAALAVLVAAGGDWRRLTCCVHCGRPFLDRTNGLTRRGCAAHPARRR